MLGIAIRSTGTSSDLSNDLGKDNRADTVTVTVEVTDWPGTWPHSGLPQGTASTAAAMHAISLLALHILPPPTSRFLVTASGCSRPFVSPSPAQTEAGAPVPPTTASGNLPIFPVLHSLLLLEDPASGVVLPPTLTACRPHIPLHFPGTPCAPFSESCSRYGPLDLRISTFCCNHHVWTDQHDTFPL